MESIKHTAHIYRFLPKLFCNSLLVCMLACTPLYAMEQALLPEATAPDAHIQTSESSSSQKTPAVYKNGKKVHPCTICKKIFPKPNKLAAHMRTHTGEKPFTCELCGQGFTQNGGLTRHMKTHTQEKEFVCDICEQAFARQDTLEQHMQTHTEEKNFKCTECKKKFSRREQLNIHMNSHTGDRPYACDMCDKTFGDPSSFSAHLKLHTGKNWYICDYPKCGYKTPQKTHLNRHVKKHTKNTNANNTILPFNTTPEDNPLNAPSHTEKRKTLKHGLSMPPMVENSVLVKKQQILRDDPVLQQTMDTDYENPVTHYLNAQEAPETRTSHLGMTAVIAQHVLTRYDIEPDIMDNHEQSLLENSPL